MWEMFQCGRSGISDLRNHGDFLTHARGRLDESIPQRPRPPDRQGEREFLNPLLISLLTTIS